MQRTALTLLFILSISLSGCAGNKDTVLPDDGHSIKRIYDEHFSDIGMRGTLAAREALNGRAVGGSVQDLSGFVRDAYHELDRHFPRLPNPTLVMYVFPHLAGTQRVPIPGYATSFSLYRHTEYALPGETHAPSPRQPDDD